MSREDEPALLADSEDALPESEGAARAWMRRDDEFLREEDREYVLRDEGRSWRSWVSPVLFGALLAVLIGDAIAIGVGTVLGPESAAPVAALLSIPVAGPLLGSVVAETGLGGLVLLKAMAAVLLLLLPGITDSARQTARAGFAGVVAVGLLVVVSNARLALAVAG